MKWLGKIEWKQILVRIAITAMLFISCAAAFMPHFGLFSED